MPLRMHTLLDGACAWLTHLLVMADMSAGHDCVQLQARRQPSATACMPIHSRAHRRVSALPYCYCTRALGVVAITDDHALTLLRTDSLVRLSPESPPSLRKGRRGSKWVCEGVACICMCKHLHACLYMCKCIYIKLSININICTFLYQAHTRIHTHNHNFFSHF